MTSTGDDEAAQRADAIKVKEMKPFTVLDAGTSDLAVFDTKFGIPAPPSFKKVTQTGATNGYPATNATWALAGAMFAASGRSGAGDNL